MLELGVGADLVRGVGAIVWGLLAIALLIALIKPKSIKVKALCALLVLGIFFGPMVPGALRAHEHQQRYAKARALFDERCKTAGEKIYRTVEGVEGVFLMKMRPSTINLSDQHALDDPYGHDFSGDDYPASMLWGKGGHTGDANYEWFGYKFVVSKSASDSSLINYSLGPRQNDGSPKIVKSTAAVTPQFGITYDDLSSREDRDSWIAGSKLQIIDAKTGEVLAERIGWMFDSALGKTSGGRQPWSYAAYNACPAFPTLHGQYPIQSGQTSFFARKVLKPNQGK
jgi:hypothetical protein